MDKRDLLLEIEDLRARLEEAEEALRAIRSGEVDALVVSSGEGEKIFTLEGADQPYRILVETMSEGAATLSSDGAVLFCNRRLAEMLGMPLEGILGKALLSHINPADAPVYKALLERALGEDRRLGESFRGEVTLLTDQGGAVPALLSCCSLDLSGDRGISVIVTDLSEQRRNEEIVAAGKLAASILEQAGEAIVVCDETGRVICASRQSQELFGANPMFRPFDQLGLLRDPQTGRPFSVLEPLHGRFCQGVEVVFQRDDRELHLLLNAKPFFSQEKILGCVVTLTDVTKGKLTEKTLKEAAGAAEDANRAKSEFLANMSHEIRTPMTVFLAALDHLLQIERNPEHRHLLEMADTSARRLRALIDEILDFSRIEARRVELAEEPFELRTCVREAVEMFALPAREKNLRLETEVSPDTPSIVVGDSCRLAQVLTNLIGNAVKFTHDGEVRVSVQHRGNSLEFSVADTGIGIPEEKRHLLFQSFSQMDSSFHRQYGGSGLGLAISRGLVELMGGRIGLRSQEGEGSVFAFTIPLKAAESRVSIPPEALPEVSPERMAARILLAEDEPMIRELITMLLARRGWQMETAETGREAVARWEKGAFDVVLMDLQMPEMDGLEATQAIRGREAAGGRRTCIIGLTAHARSEIREDCLQAGMDEVLTKPVQINDLYLAIDR
jgi:PAS domain S-box-containing protein